MQRSIKVYRAHRALALLYFLLIVLLAVIYLVADDVSGASIAFPVLVMGILFAAHYFTAKGAKESRPWARVSSIVIALLLLLGFPIGTLIGIYLLYNTWKPWKQVDTTLPAL